MLHPRAIGRSPLWKDDGHRERDGDRVRMKGASAPSAARAAARRVGTREVIRGAMPQASASTPRRVKREVIRGAMPQASASTPRRVKREVIRGAMPQASASTPRRVKREIIRGAMPQASASTPRRAEREFIRDKTRASTVVGQLAGGMSRGLSSAARERGHPRRDGTAGKGAERERWLLWTSSMGLRGCQGTRGWVGAKGGGACRWPGGPIPLGYDGPICGPCDSWDSFGPYPG